MKIRIKKVTALLLSCMLLFSISGCQKKRTAKEVLESSLKQSSKLKDADFSGEASYKIANSEASSSSNVTIKMNFDTKLQTVDKDQLKMSMTSTLNMLGQTMDMNMYYSDGYYYMNTNGTKQKIKMDIAGLQKQIQSTTGQTSLSAKYYKDLKLSEKDGNTVLKYSINNDGLNQYVKDVTSQMTTVTGGSNSIKISSLTGTKTLNDKDLPVKESIQMVMESGMRRIIDDMFTKAQIMPNILCQFEDVNSMAGLVEKNQGIAIVTDSQALRNYNVTKLELDTPYSRRMVYMAYVLNRYLPPAVEKFKDYTIQRTKTKK